DEGGRLLRADPRRGHRSHRLTAPLRVARAARPRPVAGEDRRGAPQAGGGSRMTDERPPAGDEALRLDALLDADLLVPIRSSSGEMPDSQRLTAEAFRHGTDGDGERFIAAYSSPD